MPASVALHPAAKPRDRSIAARRAARRARFERERLIVDYLNRGVSVAEIAERIGVTEKRARAVVKDILARRMPAAPEDFAALQVSRLNEALLVAYGAMSNQNLRAVALVVRIVRELDRYHGFTAADRRPRRADAEAEGALALANNSPRRARPLSAPRPGQRPGPADAPPANRPKTAPQAPETMEFAPEKGLVPKACEAASEDAENAHAARRDGVGAGSSNEALAPADAPTPSASPCAGAEMTPQAIENVDSAPGNDPAAGPTDAASLHAEALAIRGDAPGRAAPASAIELPIETRERLYPVAPVLVPDVSAPGGFRRVNIRMLPNGMAVC